MEWTDFQKPRTPKPRDTSAEHARRYAQNYVLKFEIKRTLWDGLSEQEQASCKGEIKEIINKYTKGDK